MWRRPPRVQWRSFGYRGWVLLRVSRCWRDTIVGAIVVSLGIGLSVAYLIRRPDIAHSEATLFTDIGVNYLLADEILHSKMLYRDAAYPYGPLPIYCWTAFSLLSGNSIDGYFVFVILMSAVHLGLLYCYYSRHFSLFASVFTIMALFPIVMPNLSLSSSPSTAYIPFERCALVGLMLLWRPPGRGSIGNAAAIGLVLGGMQTIKFGAAVFAVAGLAAVDLLSLCRDPGNRPWRRWFLHWLAILATAAIVEAVYLSVLFCYLPFPIAVDVAWPAYGKQFYSSMNAGYRTIAFTNLRFFLFQQLNAVTGLAASIAAVVAYLLRKEGTTDVDRTAVFFPFLFFAFAYPVYMGHIFHVYMHVWCLLAATPYVVRCLPRWRPILAIAYAIPLAILLTIALVRRPPADYARVTLPNGDWLSVSPGVADQLAKVMRQLEDHAKTRSPAAKKVLVMPVGGGWEFFCHYPRPSRHVWCVPRHVRPFDEPDLIRSLDETLAVLIVDNEEIAHDSGFQVVADVFGPNYVRILQSRIDRNIRLSRDWQLLLLKPPE